MTPGEIKRKYLLDLCVTNTTMWPTTLGCTLMLVSWALGLNAIWPFLGFIGIMAGLGFLVTNFVYNSKVIADKTLAAIQEQARLVREEELDALDGNLVDAKGTQPERDQECLRALREMYAHYQEDMAEGRLSEVVSSVTDEQIKKLFDACVQALERSYKLWRAASKSRGQAKIDLLSERDQVIEEVGKSVEQFSETIDGIRSLNLKADRGDLGGLRQQLDDSLQIAKRTVERMDAFDADMNRLPD